MDGWMVGGWMNEQVDRQLNEATDGWIHRWTDNYMQRWMDRQMDKSKGQEKVRKEPVLVLKADQSFIH